MEFKKTKWSEQELAFLFKNKDRLTIKELSVQLQRSPSAIRNKKSELGWKGFVKDSKWHCDKNFFNDINSEEKAYWLGFIAADGCVSYNPLKKNYEITIKLQSKDYNHLKKFNKSIQGNYQVGFKSHVCSLTDKVADECEIRVYSKQMAEDLIKHKVVPCKSFVLQFCDDIPTHLIPHYIRGYYDGNGGISRLKKRQTIRANFCSASKSFIEQLRVELYKFGISSYIVDEKLHNTYRLYVGGMKNCDKFLSLIYNDATIYLERKYKKTVNFYKEYNIAQRLLRRSEMSDLIISEEENGKAEMLIRVEGQQ